MYTWQTHVVLGEITICTLPSGKFKYEAGIFTPFVDLSILSTSDLKNLNNFEVANSQELINFAMK